VLKQILNSSSIRITNIQLGTIFHGNISGSPEGVRDYLKCDGGLLDIFTYRYFAVHSTVLIENYIPKSRLTIELTEPESE